MNTNANPSSRSVNVMGQCGNISYSESATELKVEMKFVVMFHIVNVCTFVDHWLESSQANHQRRAAKSII